MARNGDEYQFSPLGKPQGAPESRADQTNNENEVVEERFRPLRKSEIETSRCLLHLGTAHHPWKEGETRSFLAPGPRSRSLEHHATPQTACDQSQSRQWYPQLEVAPTVEKKVTQKKKHRSSGSKEKRGQGKIDRMADHNSAAAHPGAATDFRQDSESPMHPFALPPGGSILFHRPHGKSGLLTSS